jgi:hypothetical protein
VNIDHSFLPVGIERPVRLVVWRALAFVTDNGDVMSMTALK